MIKATLHDIAEKTGLSVSTVSRILRGESKSSSKNVALTIKTAQEINYPVNTRLLNGKYSYKNKIRVALITSFYPEEFYSTFFYGFNLASTDLNINLSLHVFDPQQASLSEFITELSYNSIESAILFLPTLQEPDYQNLILNIPSDFTLVSVAPLFNPVLDTVTFDSYRGGYIVAQHFYEKGYKEVGLITGPINKNESLLRKNGYLDFVSQKSDMKLVWQFEGDYGSSSGALAFDAYQKLKDKPRAIFSSNDYMCLGFLEQATEAKVNVPEDVAIAGYDDLPICSFIHPTITSVHTDYEMLAKKAFGILSDKMMDYSRHSGILSVIPVSLSVRNST
ncbi:MAG: LacI family DNA-binding transcriptional regulator [Balneolaceae bacterium]